MTIQVQKRTELSSDSNLLLLPELLSPAGDWASLIAAVENGADAVYLGGKNFSARRGAKNFSIDEIKKAVHYAHLRSVKIYVAVNILISDFELYKVADYLIDLYNAGVDAFIIQDWGVYQLARQLVPEISLHTSTQMNIHNIGSLKLLHDKGFKRANLSRELTLDEISIIAQSSPIELEIFIHGALCFCYSGLCYFSSMVSGRSGNRGLCIQACRLPYIILDSEGKQERIHGKYPLSMKDLSSIYTIKKICALPITALKIEGRMKSPEYVALATAAYRKILDTLNSSTMNEESLAKLYEELEWQLKEVFNRKFCAGYLEYEDKNNLVSYIRPNHRGVYIGRVLQSDFSTNKTFIKLKTVLNLNDTIEIWIKKGGREKLSLTNFKVDGQSREKAEPGEIIEIETRGKIFLGDRIFRVGNKPLLDEARKTFRREGSKRKIGLSAKASFHIGKKPILSIHSDDGYMVEESSEDTVERAKTKPLTRKELHSFLEKTKKTPYQIVKLDLEFDENAWFPTSKINSLRRKAIESLDKMRLAGYERSYLEKIGKDEFKKRFFQDIPNYKSEKLIISVLLEDINQVKEMMMLDVDWIYFDLSRRYIWDRNIGKDLQALYKNKKNTKIAIVLPAIAKDNDIILIQTFLEDFHDSFDGLVNGNPGLFEITKKFNNKTIIADIFLNTFNHLTGLFYKQEGVEKIILSQEVTLAQIKELCAKLPLSIEINAHGEMEVMQSEQDLSSSILDDNGKNNVIGNYYLKDNKEYLFPFRIDMNGYSHIYNSKPLSLLKYIPLLRESGINSIKLNLGGYKLTEIRSIFKIYKKACDLAIAGQRDLSELLLEAQNIDQSFIDNTTGHLFRGVI